jgi:hypothetical protein
MSVILPWTDLAMADSMTPSVAVPAAASTQPAADAHDDDSSMSCADAPSAVVRLTR